MTERILIADRSEDVRRALRAPLEAEGFVVSEAWDVGDALERLHGRPHHVAFVEIDLPGDGFELLDALKTDPDLAGTAVVLLSDDLPAGTVLDGLERGAADCLRKPIEPVEAVVRARAAVRVWELQQKLREGNERLTELAATDDLTGLLARRFLEAHLRGLVAAAGRHGRPLSVVMLDVDNFKDINDLHGHAVGDYVLRTVVQRMKSRLRKEDLLGRWGGDEFMVLLDRATPEEARAVASRITQAIADDGALPVTVSIGLAALQDDTRATVLAADAALYEAKAAGRNGVSEAAGGPQPVPSPNAPKVVA